MNQSSERECCEKCENNYGGGLTMLPLVRRCKNLDCPCHTPQETTDEEQIVEEFKDLLVSRDSRGVYRDSELEWFRNALSQHSHTSVTEAIAHTIARVRKDAGDWINKNPTSVTGRAFDIALKNIEKELKEALKQ